jgi:protoporphyrinogen oxidase
MRIGIIGGGISGLTAAYELKKKGHVVHLFEREESAGGLIRCTRTNGVLYHRVGGHVFNTKIKRVREWFDSIFSDSDFLNANRDARITWDFEDFIGYPIENNIYRLSEDLQESIIEDLLSDRSNALDDSMTLKEFLINAFGPTLFKIYFEPYNTKIWSEPIENISVEWLKGKLPMPNVKDILISNFIRKSETNMVHSSFQYAKHGGSQFIVDTLSKELNIFYENVDEIHKEGNSLLVNNKYRFDRVLFTGNIKEALDLEVFKFIKMPRFDLKYNSTSNVLCTFQEDLKYSWCYLPGADIKPHRIIFTGNFAESNNQKGLKSCVIEFTGLLSLSEMEQEINKLPVCFNVIDHNVAKYSYPINTQGSQEFIRMLREELSEYGVILLGRFAEWQYYNMDTAMENALNIVDAIQD